MILKHLAAFFLGRKKQVAYYRGYSMNVDRVTGARDADIMPFRYWMVKSGQEAKDKDVADWIEGRREEPPTD